MSKRRAVGVDISHWQGTVDFNKMREAGASFVYMKASENVFEDASFKNNWQAAKESGILRGAYHFYSLKSSAQSAKNQAQYFCDMLADDPGELPPVLDYESPGRADYPDYPNPEIGQNIVHQFSTRIMKNLKCYPILYTNLDGIKHLEPLSKLINSLDLWIAWYNVSTHYPKFGSFPDWRFWQYKSNGDGNYYGVESKGIDMDVFNGTVDDLYDYVSQLGIGKKTKK